MEALATNIDYVAEMAPGIFRRGGGQGGSDEEKVGFRETLKTAIESMHWKVAVKWQVHQEPPREFFYALR